MSTRFTDVKSNLCQREVNKRASASVGISSTEREEAGGLQETKGKKRITRAASDCIQTTKNLLSSPGALLKSKGEWVSTQESQNQRRPKRRFTSSLSLRFARRNDSRTNVRVATNPSSDEENTTYDAGTKVDDVQRLEIAERDFLIDPLRKSSGEATKDENASKSKTDDTVHSWGGHVKHDISSHRPSDGIQHSLVVWDQGQPVKSCTRGRSASVERGTDLQVTKQETVEGQSGVNDPLGKNAEGKLSHNNLIPFSEGTGAKANSDCQVFTCLPKAINQAFLLPSFPDSCCSNDLKSDPISSTAAMFTSTLVSVLAPHWTARLRRHKRGSSDVGLDIAQNTNLPSVSQTEQQQRLPLQQIQAQGEPVSDFSNGFKGSAGTSRSSVEWQNESFSHLSEAKKEFLKTSSLRMNRHAINQTAEFGVNPNHTSVDFGEGPSSTMSHQLSDYRRTSRTAEQGESFSSLRSRPTTSTLLLSSRRLNSRKPSHEYFPMQKELSASVSSLHSPSKSILRVSQPHLNLISPNDLSKETPVTKPFLASSEQLSNTHKPKPSSSEWEHTNSSRKQRYVITGDFDRINRNPNDAPRERSFSNYLTKFNQSEPLRSVQDHGPIDWSISDPKNSQDLNAKIPERSGWISRNENAKSRFVFPEISSDTNSGSILKRQLSTTSLTSTNLDPSNSVQSNSFNNMVNSKKTSSINVTIRPRTTHAIANSPSVNLSPVSPTPIDQNHIHNSNGPGNPSSTPVNSVRMRTFTDSLRFSPRRDSSVEGTSPSQLWPSYRNSKWRLEESYQPVLDQSSPLTPSEFKPRKVCTPSIYKYLRETSPPKSTQESPVFISPSPQIFSSKQIQEEDKTSRNQRFTFDLNSIESRDPLWKTDARFLAPQSLPPDTCRGSVPSISKSPYSTLISTRAAVNSLSSPPVTNQHSRSFSYDSTPVDDKSPKFGKRSYTSVLRDRLSRRTSSVGRSAETQLTEKTHTVCQDGASKNMADAKLPDSQTNTLNPDTTHPTQTDSVIKTIAHEALNGKYVSQADRITTCATDSWNSKKPSLPPGSSPVVEVVLKEEVTEIFQGKGTFQSNPSLNSKWSFFSLRSKKDNAPKSPASADKEGLADKRGKITGLKTNKMDQVLYRLKLTFGGTVLEDSDTASKRKSKKELFSNGQAYKSIQKENESELAIKKQIKPEDLLDSKASERTWTLDQTNDLTVRTQTKPDHVSDINGPEITLKPDQMGGLKVRTQTRPKNLSDIKLPERNQKLDQTDVLTVKRHNEDIKSPQRSQKPAQLDDVEVRAQTKPENVSDIKGPEKSENSLNQTVDLTVRKKIKNVMLLDAMPLEPQENVEQRLFTKSPTSLNAQMIESSTFSSPTLGVRHEKPDILPNMERHKIAMEESRSRLLGRPLSPNWPQPDNINCYATLPPGKRSRLGPSPTLSPFECSLDEQNDSVFFSNTLKKRDSTSPGESETFAQTNNMEKPGGQNSTGVVLSSPCANLKYGLQRKRSVSVSSVVSGRPSGPGRISTGSRQNSVSDLSSLDGFATKSLHSSSNSPAGSPENDGIASIGHISYKGPTGQLTPDDRLRSPDNLDVISFSWDMEADPTPPNSPPHTRRMSPVPSPASASSRTSPESLSPRGFLPSKNYKSTLSAFDESGSETTTDDEYYLNSDDEDEKETEL